MVTVLVHCKLLVHLINNNNNNNNNNITNNNNSNDNKSRLSLIVRVNVVLNRTVVVDSD